MTRLSVVYDMIQRGQNLGFQNPAVFFLMMPKRNPFQKDRMELGSWDCPYSFKRTQTLSSRFPGNTEDERNLAR